MNNPWLLPYRHLAEMAAQARSQDGQLASIKAKHAQDLQSLQVCHLPQRFYGVGNVSLMVRSIHMACLPSHLCLCSCYLTAVKCLAFPFLEVSLAMPSHGKLSCIQSCWGAWDVMVSQPGSVSLYLALYAMPPLGRVCRASMWLCIG